MKVSFFLILFLPLICISQDISKEFYLGYEEKNLEGYNSSGFLLGTNYQMNKIPLLNNIISSEKYYLSVEIGRSILAEVPKIYTRNGNMQTVKIGYKYNAYHNFYYLLRLRIDAVSDPSYRYNAIRADDYPMKTFTAYGPELMIGKKINLKKSLFIDIGLGLTYNRSYEVVSSGNGWFDPSKPQSYSWLNYWTKGSLKLGYQF
jgi:hypothetical protein